jgi:hypothetical protein
LPAIFWLCQIYYNYARSFNKTMCPATFGLCFGSLD